MVKPDLDLWTGTDPIFRVVNRFCILCLIGSRVRLGNGQVGSSFSFWSPLLNFKIKTKRKNLMIYKSQTFLRGTKAKRPTKLVTNKKPVIQPIPGSL
ncbi:hypothetical protein Hanom_Chr04g00337071 [Helianthus anomalus]